MTVYTVHEPRQRSDDAVRDAERFVFVRDGFYFWAFLMPPIWMLWQRLWLALILYLAAVSALGAGLWALGASEGVRLLATLLVSLLVGFEAATLWRWALARRGWKNVGVVVGADLEAAERRFFDAWVLSEKAAPVSRPGTGTPPAGSARPVRMPKAPDVVGLFPEPGAPR